MNKQNTINEFKQTNKQTNKCLLDFGSLRGWIRQAYEH